MTTTQDRQRLQTIRERTRTARAARQRARETLDAARAVHDEDAVAIATNALDSAAIEVETSERLENMLLGQMAGANGHGLGGDTFLDDPGTVAMLEQIAHSSAPIGSVMLGRFQSAQSFSDQLGRFARQAQGLGTDVSVPIEAREQPHYGVARQLYRPTFLLDVIPTAPMSGESFSYSIEQGDLDAGVGEVGEGQLKPESDVTFGQDEVRAATVATWKKMRRQELADVSWLASMITQRLSYQVQRRIEQQVLNGDGAGENLLGVLRRTGIGQVPFDALVSASDLILRGLTAVRVNLGVPSAVLLNPNTYAGMLEAKTEGSGERLDSSGCFDSPADTVWGVPIIQSGIIDETKAVVALDARDDAVRPRGPDGPRIGQRQRRFREKPCDDAGREPRGNRRLAAEPGGRSQSRCRSGTVREGAREVVARRALSRRRLLTGVARNGWAGLSCHRWSRPPNSRRQMPHMCGIDPRPTRPLAQPARALGHGHAHAQPRPRISPRPSHSPRLSPRPATAQLCPRSRSRPRPRPRQPRQQASKPASQPGSTAASTAASKPATPARTGSTAPRRSKRPPRTHFSCVRARGH